MAEIILEGEVPKLIKLCYHIWCPCGVFSREALFPEAEFIIPITKNDTPANIAEAIVKSLERRY